jgi:hypothetical protein
MGMSKEEKFKKGATEILGKSFKNIKAGSIQGFLNLAVVPLFAKKERGPEYLTMTEALEGDILVVTEISEGGSVPNLKVSNKSTTDNILLLDGEELKGAKQNRALNTSILVGASADIVVPVSCTERGRWRYKNQAQGNQLHPSPDEHMKFMDSQKIMAKEVRRKRTQSVSESLKHSANYQSNQGEVWDEISKMQANLHSHSHTGAMSDSYDARRRELEDYLRAFPLVDGQRGCVVFLNGKIAGCELLSREKAYAQLHRKIIESYAIDALGDRASTTEFPTKKRAMAFVKEVATWDTNKFKSVGLGDDLRLERGHSSGTALVVDDEVVHSVAFASEVAVN